MADFSANTTVNTSTLESLVAKTVDTVLNYSPATLFFLGNQKTWKGSQMNFPIKWASNSQGMSFVGLEKFSTTKSDNFINMYFNPTGRQIPVVISQIEADLNATNKTTDIIARQLASDAQDMASDIATLFYTLQSGNNFLSIKDAADDGTLGATTYGGLTRSSYTGIKGNYAAVGGNLTLALLRTSYNACTHGAKSPDLFLTTKAVFGYYEKLITPTVQHNFNPMEGRPKFTGAAANGMPNIVSPGTKWAGNQGFDALYWNGVPIVADESCSSGYLYMLNTKTIAFYGVPTTDPDYTQVKFSSNTMDGVYNVPVTTGFSFSGFNKPIDQYGKVGNIILVGNLICNDPRQNGVMITITGA